MHSPTGSRWTCTTTSGPNGGQAMRDHEGGAALHEVGECPLHEPLGLGVERRGGLVEDEDR